MCGVFFFSFFVKRVCALNLNIKLNGPKERNVQQCQRVMSVGKTVFWLLKAAQYVDPKNLYQRRPFLKKAHSWPIFRRAFTSVWELGGRVPSEEKPKCF